MSDNESAESTIELIVSWNLFCLEAFWPITQSLTESVYNDLECDPKGDTWFYENNFNVIYTEKKVD